MFVALAALVLAVSTSSLAAYYYLQNVEYVKQIDESRQSVEETASTYDGLMVKYNSLGSDYSVLYGSYAFPYGTNFTLLMDSLGRLIDNLEGNYSSILIEQKDLNETYQRLGEDFQSIYQEGNVTQEDFGELLAEFYELFHLLTLRELSGVVSRAITITVGIGIDYGNGTIEWHNKTVVPAGSTLFQLTEEIATINDYDYYPESKPGHIFLNSVNGKEAYTVGFTEGWSWIWYYWDDDKQDWVSGPSGCDAWMLENSGIYKWKFEHWSWS